MKKAGIDLRRYHSKVRLGSLRVDGQVTQVLGLLVEGTARDAAVGDIYRIETSKGDVLAEVVALRGEQAVLMPFGHLAGLRVGARLTPVGEESGISVGPQLKGRVLDAIGRPLDGKPLAMGGVRRAVFANPPPPLSRPALTEPLSLGVRALDAFVPCARGQRLGIFAGAGVGKSSLLGMIARHTAADVVVLALVGERGREVGHFVDQVLGPAGMAKSVVVVATSDRPAPERVRAAFVATTIAEYFRDEGASVLLFVDSLTRLCMGQRQIGLAVGEPPTTKGYPPSSFALLPSLLERACPVKGGGSVTGLYTVLVEGDDLADPVSDTARSLLDGHIVLSRRLAEQGHYPAIDILQSLSRLEPEIVTPEQLKATRRVRTWLSRLEDARDLIAVGAYRAGADPLLDEALRRQERMGAFLRQAIQERAEMGQTLRDLCALTQEAV